MVIGHHPRLWITTLCVILCAFAGLLSAPAMGGGGGMGGGGTGGGVIDPPPGAPLIDLPTLENTGVTPGIVNVSLLVHMAPVEVNGVLANLFTYNGLSPGPVIRVKRGDMLRVRLTNALPPTTERNLLGFQKNVTNLHTHGLHVSPEEPADATHLAIYPGQLYHHEYDLRMQEPGCLLFYHGHSHGVAADQYWGGMVGPIVVEDPTTALAGYKTHILVLKDIGLSSDAPLPHSSTMDYMHGKEGDIIMVNGQVNPVLSIRPGQVQRWRVLNASNARFYKLSLEGHSLQVIGTDGGLLDKPYPQSSIVLSPGERVDLLVKASTTKKNYRLLSLPYARQGNMTSPQITLLTMSCKGTALRDALPASINPEARRLNMDTAMLPKKTFVLSMRMGRAYINGHDYDVQPDETHSMLGGYEVWEIINQSGMDHPWHQHVNAAQVLSITGGDAAYRALYTTAPAWKDTVLVPKNGRVTLLMPVKDWPGMTMYHCHIMEHEDIGMMGMWHISGDMGGM
ncbi:MAG: multicopper oxidase family protein [Armatimonadota bacterium]